MTPVLADEIAAVHREHVPVDVVRRAAREEHDRAHEVDRLAPAPGWDVIEHALVDTGSLLVPR